MQRKRKHFYFVERIYTDLVCRSLPIIAKTHITPNQVTGFNLLLGVLICVLLWWQHFVAAALLIPVYLLLDVLDGNLARYRDMCSRAGAILDNVVDRLFYNAVMLVVGIATTTAWVWIVLYLVVFNLYAAITTWFIVPRIRAHSDYRRFALKQWLMDRGWILGMDLSMQDLIVSVLLVTPWRGLIVPVLTCLYGADLVFRLIELWRNRNKKPASLSTL